MSAVRWLRSRLQERSTFVGIGTAIGAASILPSPWSWLSLVAGTIAALIPDKNYGGE
ncbi:hypothetical protein BV98_000596 [Sphingobium herbicidovorans NBRC 16415]|uniref:Uncharacterized protein n=1 Tax=Sphingobium herbicidovorans (strain ATCC 700291 / DSM 11019 / CCUG 56400 / KCTC 2939 / LMG 18315 / NBRC 16415 / MH) TaxID=1219045 RepID=A0A086PEC0_SPHHM|nr:hypothetical protein [Sphingobium herbicidovorans]KFG91738.1 hypothetical protein BV98_000596 [Sphingobium herbicidovorans NBRC 16415]